MSRANEALNSPVWSGSYVGNAMNMSLWLVIRTCDCVGIRLTAEQGIKETERSSKNSLRENTMEYLSSMRFSPLEGALKGIFRVEPRLHFVSYSWSLS